MKRSALMSVAALALLLALTAPLAAQADSATVRVIDRAQLTVVVTPAEYTGEIGDTITFAAVATDPVGDTVAVIFRWAGGGEGVRVDPVTGHTTLLFAGTYQVRATVQTVVPEPDDFASMAFTYFTIRGRDGLTELWADAEGFIACSGPRCRRVNDDGSCPYCGIPAPSEAFGIRSGAEVG